MAKSPPSFDFFYNDWIGGTYHLTHVAKACYLDLLIYQWQNGSIPDTKRGCMAACHISDQGQWDHIWQEIADKFEPLDDDGRKGNPRMHADRMRRMDSWIPKDRISREELARKRSEAGRIGALKRWESDGKSDGKKQRIPPENMANGMAKMAKHGKGGDGRWEMGEYLSLSKEGSTSDFDDDLPSAPAMPDVQAEVMQLWNACEGVRKVRGILLSGDRVQKLRDCLSIPGWLDDFREACTTKFPLKFSRGGWQPDLSWILDPKNLERVLEGAYDFEIGSADQKKPADDFDQFLADLAAIPAKGGAK